MVEHIGILRCGHYQKGRTYRPLISIRRPVHHRDLLRTLAFCCKGRRSSAVQIDSGNTACIQHDLRNLNSAAAGRERFLTPIQYHHDYLTVIGNTHTGSGNATGIIIVLCGYCDLSVFYEYCRSTDSFLNLPFILLPLGAAANNRCAILQNTKEILTANTVVLYAFHYQRARRFAVAHIVEVRIDANNRLIVGNIVFCIIWIRVLFLSSLHLVCYTGHLPHGTIIVIVVGINRNIIPGDVCCRQIINNLLIIRCNCHLHLLFDARRQGRSIVGKYIIIRVVQQILCRLIQIIRKGIAASFTKIPAYTIGKIRSLQGFDAFIGAIGLVYRISDCFFARYVAKTVCQEELCADAVIEIQRKVILHNGANRKIVRQSVQNVECIQIAIQVHPAEGMNFRIIIEEILTVCADFLCHFLHSTRYTRIAGQLQKVANIAGPAAKIRCILVAGMVSHIQTPKHMRKFDLIPVGQREDIQIAKRTGIGALYFILRSNIVCKGCLFLAAERIPRTGGVFLNAAANVVDYQGNGFFLWMLPDKLICILFQNLQSLEELVVANIEFPLGIQGNIPIQIDNRTSIIVGNARAIGSRIPSDKGISLAGKGICRELCANPHLKGLRFHGAGAAVGLKGNGMEYPGNHVKLGRVGGITGNGSNAGCPALEGIAELIVRFLHRRITGISRRFPIRELLRLQDGITVFPSNRILSQRLRILSSIHCVTSNRRQCRRPALESILFRSFRNWKLGIKKAPIWVLTFSR